MSLLMNQNLVKYTGVSTANMNILCMVVHAMAAEGVYTGKVYADGTSLLGTFNLTYDAANPAKQVQIDLSSFDSFTQVNLREKPFDMPPQFVTGQTGLVVFFVSGGQRNLSATLTDSKGQTTFDTRSLDNGDTAIFRLFMPGNYSIEDTAGQILNITVSAPVDGKYPSLTSQDPVLVDLDATGFIPNVANVNPLQIIAVSIKVPATLNLAQS